MDAGSDMEFANTAFRSLMHDILLMCSPNTGLTLLALSLQRFDNTKQWNVTHQERRADMRKSLLNGWLKCSNCLTSECASMSPEGKKKKVVC